jgi:fibronectin type 3 domain-containing protein
MKISFVSILIFCFSFCFAQKSKNIMQGNSGNYIFLSEKAIGENFNASVYDYANISVNMDGKWNEIAKVQGVKTAKEFAKKVSIDALGEIGTFKNIKSEAEVWSYIQQNSTTGNYGLYAFSPNFMQALGVLYVHEFNTQKYIGKSISYKLSFFKNNKQVGQEETSIDIVQKLNAPKPQLIYKSEKDSSVQAKWYIKNNTDVPVVYGNVYKIDAKGRANLVSTQLALISEKAGDSIVFSFTDRVNPNQLFNYFIVPANYAGFEGEPSDTVSLFSVNFEGIQQAKNLTAKDTIGGIYLSFTPPAISPIITGIIVQRSRYDKTGYANIDTIPPTATHYLDQKLLPNVSYYYQLRTLSIKQLPLIPTAWASATHRNKKDVTPVPPVSITATATNKGVLIKWKPEPQSDIGGYRIYRANNSRDSLIAVSLITQENEFLDTTALDNRKQYSYAIKSINYSEVESPFSNRVFASPINNIVIPNAPNGLSAAPENGRVILVWKNMKASDVFVKGYNIYRKELNGTEKMQDKNWKTNDLLKTGYKLVNASPIENSTYNDEHVFNSNRCAYYITAVDNNGIESFAANGLLVELPSIKLLAPGNFSVRKTSTGVTISWDKSMQTGITNYIIYKREVSSTKATQLVKLEKNSFTYVDKAVQKNKTYFYKVCPANGAAVGEASVEKGLFID